MDTITNTTLWQKTLAEQKDDTFKNKRDELRVAFTTLRKNVEPIIAEIRSNFPALTVHDISHSDALWQTASLITGTDFELTPMEGFVLGCSFLLHDAAHCFIAYENEKDGLRKTITWKDAFAHISSASVELTDVEKEHEADFVTVRKLHAEQAKELLNINFNKIENLQLTYLLENNTLRKHLGALIGQISASHHWSIEKVVNELGNQFNSHADFPTEWRINPIKLACILRCADAAHIDNNRAPDFLFALLKRSSVSKDHWTAQNRLAKVDIDQSSTNKDTLLFTSTIDFEESEAKAWYVAYDAICVVDKEIKACNEVLKIHNTQTFQVTKVKGIASPKEMAQYIKAKNWQPSAVQMHVGNIENLVKTLGGEMLYGANCDKLHIVLRELIQNARDAVKAREALEKDFEGKITIKVTQENEDTWLTVEDNGVGMTERVLTGPLLDFGNSFWASDLVQSEFPGLRSSSFQSVGQFGIGFYSTFMLAEQVFVTSKSYKAGMEQTRQLKFTDGLSLRPILTKDKPDDFTTLVSTQVRLRLKPTLIPRNLMMEIKTNARGDILHNVPLKNYINGIVIGLDLDIHYSENNSNVEKIHTNIYVSHSKKLELLKKLSFSDFQNIAEYTNQHITKNADRLKAIIENDKILGVAAINIKIDNYGQDYLCLKTIGGLTDPFHYRDSRFYIGYIDYKPNSAKRESHLYTASENTIKKWAEEQLKELLKLELSVCEKYAAASSLCEFNIDSSSIALIPVRQDNKLKILTVYQLAELSKTTKIAFIFGDLINEHINNRSNINSLEDYAIIKPITNSNFLSLKFNNDIPVNNNSILDCLYRAILKSNATPIFEKIYNIGKSNLDENLNALLVSSKPNQS